jgi:hypothetical protein
MVCIKLEINQGYTVMHGQPIIQISMNRFAQFWLMPVICNVLGEALFKTEFPNLCVAVPL